MSQAESDWNAFKQAKNSVTQLIRSTKQSYFKDKINENKNNSRKLWNLIKCLSNDNKSAESGIKNLTENKENISDKQSIAEILKFVFRWSFKETGCGNRSWFANWPLNNNDSQTGHWIIWPPDNNTEEGCRFTAFYPQPIKPPERWDERWDDGISAKLLRIAAPAISPSLSKLLNLCLSMKTFPAAWKIAKVTPVFKGNGSRNDKNNYRPISVLPVLSKTLEKHICEQSLVQFP